MTNLFSYATKELSQDAFLAWLFSNIMDNGIVGQAARDLLSRFIDLYDNHPLKIDEITNVEVHQQCQHMDIAIDLFVNNEDKNPYTLVIEDKVGSSDHDNQLLVYNAKMKNWQSKKPIIKIYYKSDYLNDKEEKNVKKAEWKQFNIENINNCFGKYTNADNLILSDYANHIINLKRDLTDISNNPNVKEWSLTNFKTFCNVEIRPHINELISNNECNYWVSDYYKMYASLDLELTKKYKGSINPVLDIRFRENNNIAASIYLSDYDLEKNRWNPTDKSKMVKEDIVKNLRGNGVFKIINNKRCIASVSVKLECISINLLKDTLNKWIEKFVCIFSLYKSN